MSNGACALSIVVPVFNEEGNLPELYRRLVKVLREDLRLENFEIIFVDDASQDGSWKMIEGFHEQASHVKGIRFSRNFGHHIALSAGINMAQGAAVVMMDADLQDRPEEVPTLYKKYLEGYDVVYALHRQRQHSFFKNVTSRIFYWIMNLISEMKITPNIFRIMSRRVVDVFNQFKERDRLITGLISYAGFKEASVEVEHGKRFAGQTKYSLRKMVRLGLNSVTAFSMRPLQIASWFGFFLSFVGFLAIIWLIILKVFYGCGILGWASTMVTIVFVGGIQMVFLGLLGEYIGRIFSEVKQRPLYIVEKKLS